LKINKKGKARVVVKPEKSKRIVHPKGKTDSGFVGKITKPIQIVAISRIQHIVDAEKKL